MPKRLSLMVSFLLLLSLGLAPAHSVRGAEPAGSAKQEAIDFSDPGFGGSQGDMNAAAFREFRRADDTLNQVYGQIQEKYKNNPTFLAKLTDAEGAWIQFRDAHLESLYPARDKRQYGSVYPMVYALEKARLTWDRVKQLNQWLEFREGAVGQGSRGQFTEHP